MIKKLLLAAVAMGLTVKVYDSAEDILDYEGTDIDSALDAIEAVDEISVGFYEDGEEIGSIYVINDLDDDEKIADSFGWAMVWLDDNETD